MHVREMDTLSELAKEDDERSHARETLTHQIFEKAAATHPAETAVRFHDQELLYSELNTTANGLARWLLELGLQRDGRVAICVEQSPLTAIAILAVLKAGGTYVPVSPTHPPDRVAYVLNDARAPILITQSSLLSRFENLPAEIIALDSILHTLAGFDSSNPEGTVHPAQTAYILYTSGSSGHPTGVMVSHEALAYYLGWHCLHCRPQIGDIDLPLTSSMCFAAGVTQFYTPLLLGRTLHILSEDTIRQPKQLFGWYGRHPEFGIYCVPTLWNELVTFAEKQQNEGRGCDGPRCVLLSGEVVSERLVDRSYRLWPDIKLMNLYGPTEATANSSAGELKPGKTVTLGKPIAGTEIYLVDDGMEQVPRGEVGELCICSHGVASGYVNMPEMSRERFFPSPFGNRDKRLFRTGDLAKYTDQGELLFIGRKDFQVKIRGYRIECGEIETSLLAHPAVQNVVVVCRETTAADKQLVAYLTLHHVRYASVDELRTFLSASLPDYMIPTAFVILEALPQLPNGKLDRNKLPAPGTVRPDLAYALVPPKTVMQKEIIRIWKDVLGLQELGIDDNFFDLGGDSLKIAAAIARIAHSIHADLSYRHFFEHPTPAALAAFMKSRPQADRPLLSAIEPGTPQSTYPLAPNQRSLWLLIQSMPEVAAYNIQFSLRLEGVLDPKTLEETLGSILKRHDSLRTVIRMDSGQPVAQILDFEQPTVKVQDIIPVGSWDIETEASRIAAEECSRPFKLETGPLVRFNLYRLKQNRHRLTITVQHLAFDGMSINVFCRAFVNSYRSHCTGQLTKQSLPQIQYCDYVAWQGCEYGTDIDDRLLEFWKQHLDGSPLVLDFPTDYPRPAIRTFRGACKKIRLGSKLRQRLKDFCLEQQATPFMTLLSVFSALLHRYSNQEDILVGSPIANRSHIQAEELIGFFANTVAMRIKFRKEESFVDLLSAVRETCLKSFEHGSVSFEKLVRAIQPERRLSHTPIFQVMFAHHEELYKGWVDDQLWLETYEDGNLASKYDFGIDAQDFDGGMELRLTYSSDLFNDATMQRFLDQYVTLLTAVLAHPQKLISDYRLESDAEQRTIMVDWNATVFDNDRNRALHRLFEDQVVRSPDNVALTFDKHRTTYEGLNGRANQLARYLVSQGVKQETRIGIHTESSSEMIVALLAILKAGATYVPLDPYYPKERLAYIIEDSGVTFILSQSSFATQLPTHSASVIVPAAERDEIDKQLSTNLDTVNTSAESLIYLMYTSGSTGRPKGVMVPHRGACNYVLWMKHQFPLSPEDKVLNKTSINFDISIWEIFLPLISGAQLVLGRQEELQAPEGLAALINNEQITNIQLVPSALRAFVDSGMLPACDSLNRIFSGGEALSTKLQEDVFESFSGELHNLYGPTEASIYVCHWVCERHSRLRSVPIGRPIHNAKVHILDPQLNPVSVGMTGEIYIGGEVLAKGYLNKPEVTAAKFVADPHADEPDARLFRTGDVGRYLSDGAIEFLGRADRQVKVRGYRIELNEIEHSLTKHPRVNHAIVIVKQDREDDLRLVAYLLYRDKKGPDVRELREYLKQKLPDYMIPSSFVELDSIPLLPNSKVDLKALPGPEYKKTLDRDLERIYANDLERNLAQIWEEVLETQKFSPDDNFFEVGGHSLLIARMRILVEAKLNRRVSSLELLQHPTVRSLAKHLGNKNQPLSQLASNVAKRVAKRNGPLKLRNVHTEE